MAVRAASDNLQAAILGWYDANGRTLAFRSTSDPYAVLVSEVMAQQTQISRVSEAWSAFLVAFPTIRALAGAEPADVLRAQLAGAVVSPLTTVVGLFAAPMRDLVGVLEARIRQLEEQGETVPEAEEPQAEAPAEEPQAEAPAEEPQAEEPADESTEEPSAEATAEPGPETEQEEESSG